MHEFKWFPFDKIKKYMIFNNKSYTVIVLRYEDIKQWDNIFTKIFKIWNVKCALWFQ